MMCWIARANRAMHFLKTLPDHHLLPTGKQARATDPDILLRIEARMRRAEASGRVMGPTDFLPARHPHIRRLDRG